MLLEILLGTLVSSSDDSNLHCLLKAVLLFYLQIRSGNLVQTKQRVLQEVASRDLAVPVTSQGNGQHFV